MTIRFFAGGLLPPTAPLTLGTSSGRVSPLLRLQLDAQSHLFFKRTKLSLLPSITAAPRERIDLRDNVEIWPVRDQGTSMMCVAFAVGACIELKRALDSAQRVQPTQLSAGYLYWAMRQHPPPGGIEGWEKGGTRSDCAVAALADQGICELADCPDELGLQRRPPDAAAAVAIRLPDLREAVNQVPGQPAVGRDAETVVNYLADVVLAELDARRPVCMGFPVFRTANTSTNWNDAGERDGTVEFPVNARPNEYIGGHAVCVVGYQPDQDSARTDGGYFIFRNSSGPDFGTRHAIRGVTGSGYGRISAKDAQNNCWDYFSLRPRDRETGAMSEFG